MSNAQPQSGSQENTSVSIRGRFIKRRLSKDEHAAYEEYLTKILQSADVDWFGKRAMKKMFRDLKNSYGHAFIMHETPEEIQQHARLLFQTSSSVRSTLTSRIATQVTRGFITHPVYFASKSAGTISATTQEISYKKKATSVFTPNDAMAMALLAANNQVMLKGGIVLAGTEEQQKMLREAINAVNAFIPGEKLRIVTDKDLTHDAAKNNADQAKDNISTSNEKKPDPSPKNDNGAAPDILSDDVSEEQIQASKDFSLTKEGREIIGQLHAIFAADSSPAEKIKKAEDVLNNHQKILTHEESPLFEGVTNEEASRSVYKLYIPQDSQYPASPSAIYFAKHKNQLSILKMDGGPQPVQTHKPQEQAPASEQTSSMTLNEKTNVEGNNTQTDSPEAEQESLANHNASAANSDVVWENRDHDIPVAVRSIPKERGADGRLYAEVGTGEEQKFVPLDELKYRPKKVSTTVPCWQEFKIAAMDIAAKQNTFDDKEGLNFFLSKARAPAHLRKDI